MTIVFSDLKGSTSLGEALDSGGAARGDGALLRGDARPRSSATAARSRSSSATPSWPCSASRRRTRTTRCARSAPPPTCSAALDELNAELERVWGVRLTNRTGVNTGEVVAGDPTAGQRLVTGDAVNVAARLEQAAPANEISSAS